MLHFTVRFVTNLGRLALVNSYKIRYYDVEAFHELCVTDPDSAACMLDQAVYAQYCVALPLMVAYLAERGQMVEMAQNKWNLPAGLSPASAHFNHAGTKNHAMVCSVHGCGMF